MKRVRLLPIALALAVVAALAVCVFCANTPAARQERLDRALQDAIQRNDTAGVEAALARGANPNATFRLPTLGEQRTTWMRRLRERLPGGQVPPPDVWTPLAMQVAWEYPLPNSSNGNLPENPAIVCALLDRGADARVTFPQSTIPLLSGAAMENWAATVRLLLAHGADPNARDRMGWTTLMEAVASDAPQSVRALLAHGADANAVDRDGDAVLDIAVSTALAWHHLNLNQELTVVRLLLTHGADVRQINSHGDTALANAQRLRGKLPQVTYYLSPLIALLQSPPQAKRRTGTIGGE